MAHSPAKPPSRRRRLKAPAFSATGSRRGSARISCGEAGSQIGLAVEEVGHVRYASSSAKRTIRILALNRLDTGCPLRGHDSELMPPPVFRFAPSPNGYLHLGHALSALLNADMARAAGGRLLLRIEDIDAARCRPEYEAAIYEDLAWLGIAWEQPVRRQSEHFDDYRAALARLEAQGLIYPSFESRAEIAALVAEREAQARGRAIPTARRFIPGDAKIVPPPSAPGASRRASLMRCGSICRRRSRAPAR